MTQQHHQPLLPICILGDPVLRQKAEPILTITQEVRDLVAHMEEFLLARPGWGLSAPQVGHSIRLFVAYVPDSRAEKLQEPGDAPLQVFINPKLSAPSAETATFAEGCFSLPGIYPEVTRPKGITVEALDLSGTPFHLDLWGWAARIVMHENDHLNGVLFLDRVSAAERRKWERAVRALKKEGPGPDSD